MKRFLALLCTVATTLTLVGCNDAAPSTSSDSVNKQDQDMVNESQGNEGGNNGLSGILGEDNGIFEEETPTGMILTINGNEYDLTGHFNEEDVKVYEVQIDDPVQEQGGIRVELRDFYCEGNLLHGTFVFTGEGLEKMEIYPISAMILIF